MGALWFFGGLIAGILLGILLFWIILREAFEDIFKRRK
jgi:uncharacterized protein involved in exopolysaccharide biosynthesis